MVPTILEKASRFRTIFTATELTKLSLLSIHPLYMNLLIYEKVWMEIVTKQKTISIDTLPEEDIYHVCESKSRENHNIARYGNIV